VVLGGLLVLRWPKLAWLHVPAAAWGSLIEFAGWICPLTPLEHYFRRLAGEQGYAGGFIEHYITRVMYPSGLTRGIQIGLGVFVLVLNLSVYTYLILRQRRARHHPTA
jgi:hypothetical protein